MVFIVISLHEYSSGGEEGGFGHIVTVKGRVTLGIRRTGAEENICLSMLKTFCCSLVQIQVVLSSEEIEGGR